MMFFMVYTLNTNPLTILWFKLSSNVNKPSTICTTYVYICDNVVYLCVLTDHKGSSDGFSINGLVHATIKSTHHETWSLIL